jgi:hypothetical protein
MLCLCQVISIRRIVLCCAMRESHVTYLLNLCCTLRETHVTYLLNLCCVLRESHVTYLLNLCCAMRESHVTSLLNFPLYCAVCISFDFYPELYLK